MKAPYLRVSFLIGCFDGIDCSLMVHPFTEDAVVINALARSYHRVIFTSSPPSLHTSSPPPSPHTSPPSQDLQNLPTNHTTHQDTSLHSTATYLSKSDPNLPPSVNSHPNPLDAAVLAYTSLSLLRQQLQPSWMIHGVISNGGTHPDVRPTSVEMLYYFRAPSYSGLKTLQEKALACFDSAALATGCGVSITEKARTYKDVVSNRTLVDLFLENSRKLGLEFSKSTQNFSASTDLGNVSHVVPSIHPVYSIGRAGTALHTRGFAALTDTPTAHRRTLLAAQTVALTAVDVMYYPHLLTQVKHYFSLSGTS